MRTSVSGLNVRWEIVGSCPICGSTVDEHTPFESIADGQLQLEYAACRRCGLVFQSPRMDRDSMNAFYQRVYHDTMMPGEDEIARNRWVQEQRASYLVAEVKKTGHTPDRLLDIGSSRGVVMSAFARAFDCESMGVEPGDQLRLSCQEQGLQVYESLEDVPVPATGFGAVTLSHTLEHIANPLDTLDLLRERYIARDGLILVEVPNLIWHRALELTHVLGFTQASLKHCLRAGGFQVLDLMAHGQPYSRRLPLFLLAAASPAPTRQVPSTPIPAPRLVKLRRRLARQFVLLVQSAIARLGGERRPWQANPGNGE